MSSILVQDWEYTEIRIRIRIGIGFGIGFGLGLCLDWAWDSDVDRDALATMLFQNVLLCTCVLCNQVSH